jgi:hypothetical protein
MRVKRKTDTGEMTAEQILARWPFADQVSHQLTEMRTVLSRAETAYMNNLTDQMDRDLEDVINILEKYRRVKLPKRPVKTNQEILDTP